MQWQIINHFNELLITRVFYATNIKVSPPIEIPGTFAPIVHEPYPRDTYYSSVRSTYATHRVIIEQYYYDMNTKIYISQICAVIYCSN